MRPNDRFRSVWFLLSPVLLAMALAAPVLGQDTSRIRVGAGAAMRGDFLAGWGGHGLLEFSASPDTRFDLRSSGSFAAGTGAEAVFGLDVIGVVALGADDRPYVGLGLGYSHTDFSASQPFAYDLGVSVAAGFEWRRRTRTWFLEARLRSFGNVFYELASTQTVFLLSLGRSVG